MDDMAEFRGRVRRGPWVGNDLNNVFAQASAVSTEPMSIAQDIGMPPWQSSRVQTGLENHNFRDDPPDTTANLNDITNKLPGWDFTQASGTAITAKWVADASSGSGGVIRFDVAAGAAGDHSYIEQVVSVASSRAQTWDVWGLASFVNRSASRSFTVWGEAQALKSDGTTTGTPTAFATLWSDSTYTLEQITIPQASSILPTDAMFIRFRVGVKRAGAATSDTGTIDLAETRLLDSQPYGVFADSSATSLEPAVILQKSGNLYIHPQFDPTKINTPGYESGNVPFMRFPDTGTTPVEMLTYTNLNSIEGGVQNVGWVHRAFPQGISPHSVSSTNNTLTAQYDAMMVPIIIHSPMRVASITVRQGVSDGTQRNFGAYLCAQKNNGADDTTLVVLGGGTTGNYTAAATSNESITLGGATGFIDIDAGTYWVIVQNAHATRSHSTRMVSGGDWTPNTAANSTTVGDLSAASTVSATSFSTKLTNTPMVRLNGHVLGEGAVY